MVEGRWLIVLLGESQRLGLLGSMRVLVAFEHFQFGHQHPAEAILGNHAPHGVSDELLGLPGADLLD